MLTHINFGLPYLRYGRPQHKWGRTFAMAGWYVICSWHAYLRWTRRTTVQAPSSPTLEKFQMAMKTRYGWATVLLRTRSRLAQTTVNIRLSRYPAVRRTLPSFLAGSSAPGAPMPRARRPGRATSDKTMTTRQRCTSTSRNSRQSMLRSRSVWLPATTLLAVVRHAVCRPFFPSTTCRIGPVACRRRSACTSTIWWTTTRRGRAYRSARWRRRRRRSTSTARSTTATSCAGLRTLNYIIIIIMGA